MKLQKPKLAVSACLLGENCKYNGGNNLNKEVTLLADRYQLIPVCPETAGGMSVPRLKAEIRGGDGNDVWRGTAKVINSQGADVTDFFCEGAQKTLAVLKKHDIAQTLLKEGSPSCGYKRIYDGTFSGRFIRGEGVTAALLRSRDIVVKSEENREY